MKRYDKEEEEPVEKEEEELVDETSSEGQQHETSDTKPLSFLKKIQDFFEKDGV